MFSKISRYRNIPVVTAPDASGRELAAVDIRLLPDVTGDFRHTVDGGDRLDQLGTSTTANHCNGGTSPTPTPPFSGRSICWTKESS